MKQCNYIPEKEAYLIMEERKGRVVRQYSDTHYNKMDEHNKGQIDTLFENAFKDGLIH